MKYYYTSNPIFQRSLKKSDPILGKMIRCLNIVVIIYLGFSILQADTICSEEFESSVTNLNLVLEPVITVEADTPVINIRHTGNREIEIIIPFTVEANTKQVNMFVEATAFYLNGVITDSDVDPIPLLESSGAYIDPSGATLVSGTNPAAYIDNGDPIGNYPSRKTDLLTFEGPGLMFRHGTDIKVTWDQHDQLKPAGNYLACIRLTCIAIPSQ